jgi:hypothetical protein
MDFSTRNDNFRMGQKISPTEAGLKANAKLSSVRFLGHIRIYYSGVFSGPDQFKREMRTLIIAATQLRREKKHEESALGHCVGNGGIAGVGADYAAAPHE